MHTPAPSGDPRIAFWSNPATWPDDDLPGHIFLGRVVDIVGQAVFGADWTGFEPAVELVTPLTETLDATIGNAELVRGCRLLFDHDEAYSARCPAYAEYLHNWPIPTEEEWARGVVSARNLSEQRRRDFNRFTEVCSRLASAFKQGTVLTATRAVDGGLMREQDRWFWNTENFWWRFSTCRVDATNPYRATAIVEGGEYLFVDRPTLAAALEPPPEPVQALVRPEMTEDQYLSPYLRCMIATTRALGLAADDQRKKQDLVVELRKHWTESPQDLTGEDLERMATLMREPAHKGGRKFKKQA